MNTRRKKVAIKFRLDNSDTIAVCHFDVPVCDPSRIQSKVTFLKPSGLSPFEMQQHLRAWHEWLGGFGKPHPDGKHPVPSGWKPL